MKKSRIVSAVIVASTLVLGSSCSVISPASSTPETVPTTAATSVTAVTDSSETTAATTVETTKAPTAAEIGTEYLRTKCSASISLNAVYLLSEQEATLIDSQVSDGITPSDAGKIRLPAGTVMVPMHSDGNLSAELSDETIFVLTDGRCVTLDISVGQDGKLLINGLSETEIFGRRADTPYVTPTVKDEGELRAMVATDPNVAYKVLTVKIDWNGDGVGDTFRRELTDGLKDRSGTLLYTDGATGKTTDVTECCATDNEGYIGVLANQPFLYKDKDGNQMILDSFDVCSSDIETFVYTYDPEKILTYTKIDGGFVYENNALYILRDSTIFGNCEQMVIPVTVADDTVTQKDITTEIYWYENRSYVKDAAVLPPVYTCTLQEFTAEKISGDTIEAITIPAGIAIFPLYSVVDESGAGRLYFRTVANGDCQASYTENAVELKAVFGKIDQNELFWCGFGD